MRHDPPVLLGDDVGAAQGVLPVLLGHPAIFVVVAERGPQEIAQLGDLLWAQLLGADAADGLLDDLPAPT
jgi:hypothetical protein